jgi:hypothetical protein
MSISEKITSSLVQELANKYYYYRNKIIRYIRIYDQVVL